MSMFNLYWDFLTYILNKTGSHVIIQNTYDITYWILYILGGTRIKSVGAR